MLAETSLALAAQAGKTGLAGGDYRRVAMAARPTVRSGRGSGEPSWTELVERRSLRHASSLPAR